jgi:hypothetical protein
MFSQSGFVLSGLAMTIPESAPEAQLPAAPILHSKFVNAIGLSVAMKESTERFSKAASRSWTRLGPGSERTVWIARLPTIARDAKAYMIGRVRIEPTEVML